ncbi:hypothetical protein V6N11_001413 [Hibiscus sabdariffa]|uniref:Uncharacterized protein n=1 Tax=Hibiscus sabdariffa TaxID=183260 RepID=A0ABR2RZX8_9ROSI
MEQARLDCYSVGFNCQCFNFIYASALIICSAKMTKGMSRQRQRVLLGQISRQTFRFWQSALLRYWLIPKSNNLMSWLYLISLGGKMSPFITDVTRISSLQDKLFVASS